MSTDDFSDLATSNPSNRCPVVLLLDQSGSMEGQRLRDLSSGLSKFIDSVCDDPVARRSVDLSILGFGNDNIRTICDFTEIANLNNTDISLNADGSTPMATAIRTGLAAISKRRKYYKDNNIQSYAPFLILMTDGEPNDLSATVQEAKDANDLSDKGKLVYIGIGMTGADMGKLRKIVAGKHAPVSINDAEFSKFFAWLSDSLRTVTTRHSPGDDISSKVNLDVGGL